MSIRIICKKIPKYLNGVNNQNKILNRFYDYNDFLTLSVKKYNGFVKSESYYNSNISEIHNKNIDSILTLSEWDSHIDWNKWFQSNERLEIYNLFKDVIKKEDIYVLKKDNIFLL
jgi:heme-degrading monooxygenase HmoA